MEQIRDYHAWTLSWCVTVISICTTICSIIAARYDNKVAVQKYVEWLKFEEDKKEKCKRHE